MIRLFEDLNVCERALDGQPALDQVKRHGGLNNTAIFVRAGVSGPDRHNHPCLGRDDIQPFAAILAALGHHALRPDGFDHSAH